MENFRDYKKNKREVLPQSLSLALNVPATIENVQYTKTFPNGWGVSVIQQYGSYGAEEGLWELAVIKNGKLHYANPVANGDVVGHLSERRVNELCDKIKRFKPTEDVIKLKRKIADKKYYEKNKDKVKKKVAKYYQENKERISERKREWYKKGKLLKIKK